MRRCFILFFVLLSRTTFKQPAAGNLSWEKVRAWFENFEEYLSRTDVITPGQLQKLPVGLRTDIGNYCYDLLFTDAVFGPDHTELSVYLRISGPDWQGEERVLYFGADKVLISQRGGFIGEVKLALLGDVSMKGKGDQFHLRFLGRKEEGEDKGEGGVAPRPGEGDGKGRAPVLGDKVLSDIASRRDGATGNLLRKDVLREGDHLAGVVPVAFSTDE